MLNYWDVFLALSIAVAVPGIMASEINFQYNFKLLRDAVVAMSRWKIFGIVFAVTMRTP